MGMRRTHILVGLGLGMVLGACGQATPAMPASTAPATAPATSAPSEMAPANGITLALTAQQPEGQELGWDVWELIAPADQSFDVAYVNNDKGRHDFAVLPEAGFVSEVLFTSEMVSAHESATITVPGLPVGTYDFVCSLHSTTMRGTLTVR